MEQNKEELLPPEYDEQLNHVFFLKSSLSDQEVAKSDSLRRKFFQSYKLFFENRQKLINELRDIADEIIRVQQSCNISHIVGGSLGIAGGTTALIGTAFPPLLFGGLVVTGLATLTNLGTSLTQFLILRKLIQRVSNTSKYDISLLETLEGIYSSLISSNLFDIVENSVTGEVENLESVNLQLGLYGAGSEALAVGMKSLGVGMVEISSNVLKGVGRSAVGIGVVIDGMTIYIRADDLAKGGNSKLSEALRKLADEKEMELNVVKRKINASGLFTAFRHYYVD
uniref:Apolipoprotein L3-like n=1 Tax=Syphacia muris TaxID=451379 RepID=A0A0N5ADK5_9BILA